MNDLMTKSFVSYVELQKQAQEDATAEFHQDLEEGQGLDVRGEQNLSEFFKQVSGIELEMEDISNLLLELQTLNEESKSAPSNRILRGLRDRMDSNTASILLKANSVRTKLQSLDRNNLKNRKTCKSFKEGSSVDRTRMSITTGLRTKLRGMMSEFQALRDKIVSEHKEYLKRRYFNETGEELNEEMIEKMVSPHSSLETLNVKQMEVCLGNKERHEVVMDLQKSLDRLQKVFLDMGALVEKQGEELEDIEENVASGGRYISGGTDSYYYANQMRKRNQKCIKWIQWVCAILFVMMLICIVSLFVS